MAKLTTWQVLRHKFPEQEYVLIQEVADASGFSKSRSLDFMLINLWHSRGLAITGIERKSNRGDWLKEIKQPAKQENHFKFCDYFYLLTDKDNVAKLEEIPDTWGWYHINERQILKTLKPAPKLTPIPVNRSFLCAMMRRAASKQNYIHADSVKEHIASEAERTSAQNNRDLLFQEREYQVLKERVEEFEKVTGIKLAHPWYGKAGDIGDAVKIILEVKLKDYYDNLKRVENMIKNIHEGISTKIEVLKNFTEHGQ